MIEIELSGGLGNQMFQYALYLKLKKLGKRVFLNTDFYKNSDADRKLQLDIFQGVDSADRCWAKDKSFVSNMMNKLFSPKVYKDKINCYQPCIYNFRDAVLSGYWQSELYFSDIREDILKVYTFKDQYINDMNRTLSKKMIAEQSVSVHIRRGDYLNNNNIGIYGQVCTDAYYQYATEQILNNKNINDAVFYFFSDDIEWVKDNIESFFSKDVDMDYLNIKFVDINKGDKSYLDMYLMSSCKHHIIANSTFSWWGAWLGENEDKMVIAPKKWFQNYEENALVCVNWITN